MKRRLDRHSLLRLRGGKLRRESRKAREDWIPASAGMTFQTAVSLPYRPNGLLQPVVGWAHRKDFGG